MKACKKVIFWPSWSIFKAVRVCAQSHTTLCDPIDCSPPGSSVHGILQARILEWVAISFSKNTYILKQNRNGHLSMCCLKSFMSLIVSVKKNTEEWAGFGSEFGITKHCFSAPCHGIWFMDLNFLQWQIHTSSFNPPLECMPVS